MANYLMTGPGVVYLVEDYEALLAPSQPLLRVIGYAKTPEPVTPPHSPEDLLITNKLVPRGGQSLKPVHTTLVYGDVQRWVNHNAYLWHRAGNPEMEGAWHSFGQALLPKATADGKAQ